MKTHGPILRDSQLPWLLRSLLHWFAWLTPVLLVSQSHFLLPGSGHANAQAISPTRAEKIVLQDWESSSGTRAQIKTEDVALGSPVTLPSFKLPESTSSKVPGTGGGILEAAGLPSGAGSPGTGQSCSPKKGGFDCPCDAPATLPADGPDVSVGNPINVITGNKYQAETDLAGLPGVLGLEWVRHYNSVFASAAFKAGSFGQGWRHTYSTQLFESPRDVQIIQADGSRLTFSKVNSNLCQSQNPNQGQVKRSGKDWVWQWTSGRELTFDSAGHLVQIKARTGEAVSLSYDLKNRLQRVTDPQRRTLELRYATADSAQIVEVQSPLGIFHYQYQGSNLVQVSLPAAPGGKRLKQYLFEDPRYPSHLTGMTDSGQLKDGALLTRRISSYLYDEQGRAVLSSAGLPAQLELDNAGQPRLPKRLVEGTGIEQVHLRFDKLPSPTQIGKTVLTNSLGQETEYTHTVIGGQYRLLSIQGSGCSRCSQNNVRFEYIQDGALAGQLKLVTQIDDLGKALTSERFDFDRWGRVVSTWEIDFRQSAKPTWAMSQRFEYTDANNAFEPTVIARPSVVAGKEHVMAIQYNGFGQPIKLTETGFSPQTPNQELAVIERTKTLSYTRVNGRQLLQTIDGPLANGPKQNSDDSDLTHFKYDQRGDYSVSVKRPDNQEISYAYDSSGLLRQITHGLSNSIEFKSELGRVQAVVFRDEKSKSARTQLYQYDALGQAVELGESSSLNERYRPIASQGFDSVGKPLWVASKLGVLVQHSYDTEARVVQAGKYSNAMAMVERNTFNEKGRLSQTVDNSALGFQFKYDASGQLQKITDALGRDFEFSTLNRKNTPASANSEQIWVDDFGRKIAHKSPDSGLSTHRYDNANQLIQSQDAKGNRASYSYDLRGRVRHQTILDQATAQEIVTQWHFEGDNLVLLEHNNQTDRYEYNGQGYLAAHRVQIKPDPTSNDSGAKPVELITRFAYQADGTLAFKTLPNGSLINYKRNEQGQVVELQLASTQSEWAQKYLGWLFPSRVIVADLHRDLVGLKSYSYGNQIQAQFIRSTEGRLARIVYHPSQQHAQWVQKKNPKTIELGALIGLNAAVASTSNIAKLPGALDHPIEPKTVIDHRYLWDATGNLHFTQSHGGSTKPIHYHYAYDRFDQLIASYKAHSENQKAISNRYYYEGGRRVLAQEGLSADQTPVAATIKSRYEAGTNRLQANLLGSASQVKYDNNGHVEHRNGQRYVWNALGQLTHVYLNDTPIAAYRYNHSGERVSKTTFVNSKPQTIYYFYQDGLLSAELSSKGKVVRQYVYLATQPVAVLDQTAAGKKMNYLHTNHLGAPEAATNENGQVVWRAAYEPFGATTISTFSPDKSNAFSLNLRLPGQYEDVETGLFYNKKRYYNPNLGQYISPDPLGTPDGANGYRYVRYNPLKYVDPEGLSLFAFDGTGNGDDTGDPAMAKNGFSNVKKFYDAYDQDKNGKKYYVSGVGVVHRDLKYGNIYPNDAAKGKFLDYITPGDPLYVNDMGGNYSGPARIERMMLYLRDEADRIKDDNGEMFFDVIGFSRGAAQARDFANRVVANTKNGYYLYKSADGKDSCQKINFRFMGLWDSVLSTNWSGIGYKKEIPQEFARVSHAVALNEYRSDSLDAWSYRNKKKYSEHLGGFPLESIGASSERPGQVRIERGFLGAHADIGGGYPESEGSLSLVALNWMVRQAKDSKISFLSDKLRPLPPENPVLHDESNAINLNNPTKPENFGTRPPYSVIKAEDRQVNGAFNGNSGRTMGFNNNSLTNAKTHEFINYTPRSLSALGTGNAMDPSKLSNKTGTVNIKDYLEWLQLNGYKF
jgi:RHS repeat-associated protein